MQLATETFGQVTVIHAPDELNEERTEGFLQFISTLKLSNLVLDLDSTEIIDSVGLEALLQAQSTAREEEGDLKITTTNAMNRKILEITRLDERMEVFDSVIDAVKSFS